jgi:sucrose-6F-phosphate phosphohydrolase
MKNDSLLICTDLDRTLIPNGVQPESAGAMDLFRNFVSRPNVSLAYVTGRHRELVEDAIEKFSLPQPDYVVADVGTTIYALHGGDWDVWEQWSQEIAPAWKGMSGDDMHHLLDDISALNLQEPYKQNRFKLSYYVPLVHELNELEQKIETRLQEKQIRASLVWSVDSVTAVGLLDILPESASKQHAIQFLMSELKFDLENTVFAGDSGNDVSVLVSPIKSVLVANATNEVRQEVIREAEASGLTNAVYLAKGGFNGMNGNYSAGIMEGVAHYHPQYEPLLRS